MTKIVLNIPDGKLQRVITAVALARGYRDTMSDGTANPETKAAFCERMIKSQLKEWVQQGEGMAADIAARTAVDADKTLVT